MKLIFLDDVRSPFENNGEWLTFSPIPIDDITQLVWIKDYRNFTMEILTDGIPDAICFDYDLDQYKFYAAFDGGKNGYDCAKFLIEQCEYLEEPLPKYNIHSGNKEGKEKIRELLENFKNKQ